MLLIGLIVFAIWLIVLALSATMGRYYHEHFGHANLAELISTSLLTLTMPLTSAVLVLAGLPERTFWWIALVVVVDVISILVFFGVDYCMQGLATFLFKKEWVVSQHVFERLTSQIANIVALVLVAVALLYLV
jgi:hypothetical protein